jgi:hypothetical protein
MLKSTGRDGVIEYLKLHLFGPRSGQDELITDSPSNYYTTGVLFPVSPNKSHDDSAEIIDDKSSDGEDDPVPRTDVTQPASIAITFVTTATNIDCVVTFGTYAETGKKWTRTPHEAKVVISELQNQVDLLPDRARLVSRWRRPNADGARTVTVALVNSFASKNQENKKANDAACLFQVRLTCEVPSGSLLAQSPVIRELSSEEEDELSFQYRNQLTFGVGHGCAARWDSSSDETPTSITAECFPVHEVASMSPTTSRASYLDLRFLASLAPDQVDDLLELVNDYEAAIQRMASDNIPTTGPEKLAAARLVAQMKQSAARMREGVRLLRQDENLLAAFRLANEAMLLQMWRTKGNSTLNGLTRNPIDPIDHTPQLEALAMGEFFWRPFQLGFMLMNIAPLSIQENEFRDVVDLIWFPTGGGKTEAYLFVTAFEVLRRRLVLGEMGSGTTVISRYTMRLLTAQQFERASTLVCALELLRQRDTSTLGRSSIDIGLWIGQDNTPNTFTRAKEVIDEIEPSWAPPNPFAIQRCPWCHTRLLPGEGESIANLGFKASNSSFLIFCPNSTCEFNKEIPLQVVDEALYNKPPTVLLAVVDKFAALPRETRIRNFFGGNDTLPPSLIIQDELHLLGSSLGTVFGVYEAAIDTIIGQIGGGHRPHIIASTATIRDAKTQVHNLFGREVRVFPAPGLSADYNYFSSIDKSVPGRKYIGIAAPSHTPSTSIIRTVALLAQSINEVTLSNDETDAYFTQVVYHNSLRELGSVITYASDDIPDWVGIVASPSVTPRQLSDDNIAELTGNVRDWELPRLLERLQVPASNPACIALLACTNMLSVGVDVQRLGLMTVNGQPKATSEYIQATSRVGRRASTHAGLVITHYATGRPRDMSHYETFHSYHQSLYRFVEPTSVTPWALPSRERCLPAVVIALIRHVKNLRNNDDADELDLNDPETKAAIAAFLSRISATNDNDSHEAVQHTSEIMDRWSALSKLHPGLLRFTDEGHNFQPLMTTFSKKTAGAWPILTSFRNVDRGCEVEVQGWFA